MFFRRIFGFVFLIIGAGTVVLCAIGISLGRGTVDTGADQIHTALGSAAVGLETARDTLLLTRSTIVEVNASLGTVEAAARNAATAISDTQPLLDEIQVLTAETVPASLETFEDTMPQLIEVAGAIDDTLTTLSRFQFDQQIPLGTLDFGAFGAVELPTINLGFGLGIDYEPERPFDESVEELGASLEGVPAQLRTAGENLGGATGNLAIISADLDLVANDISRIEGDVAQVPALLDDYLEIIDDLEQEVRSARGGVDSRAATIKLVLTITLVWLALTQAAPLYLGYELVSGNRPVSAAAADAADELAAEKESEES